MHGSMSGVGKRSLLATAPNLDSTEKCLKKHRVFAKMLLLLNKQLLGKDTLWKQSAITSSGLKAFFPRK
jgi:hypothetical protein